MASLYPEEAAQLARGTWAVSRPTVPLGAFAIDTRNLRAGETFVALRSDRADGHAFLSKARENRAVAALVERADASVPLPQLVVENSLAALQELAGHWRGRFRSPVIGVTGSFGKTTVKEMLGSVLGSAWFRTRGNLNNHIGVPLSILELDPRHHAGAILEAGINAPGEMRLLADLIRPDITVITAVGPAHLEQLGDLEGVAREKAGLAMAVRPGGSVFAPAAVLQYSAFRNLPAGVRIHAVLPEGEPADPAWEALPAVTLHRYSWTEAADSRGLGTLAVRGPAGAASFPFRAGSPGMVSNLALVVHAALHLGVPPRSIQNGLDEWKPFTKRGEIIRHGATVYYVDCYNANPGSMLDSARRFANLFPDQRHLYVLGSMNELGPQAAFWHRQTAIGLTLQQGAEIHLVGDWAQAFAEGLAARGIAPAQLHRAGDLDGLRERLGRFEGAVFLKGSRSLGLEALLPQGGELC